MSRNYAIKEGRAVVAASATAAKLSTTSVRAQAVVVTAETDNTGLIVVGGSTVVADLATRKGTPLAAGDSLTIELGDLSKIWIDSTVSGDGVTWLAVD